MNAPNVPSAQKPERESVGAGAVRLVTAAARASDLGAASLVAIGLFAAVSLVAILGCIWQLVPYLLLRLALTGIVVHATGVGVAAAHALGLVRWRGAAGYYRALYGADAGRAPRNLALSALLMLAGGPLYASFALLAPLRHDLVAARRHDNDEEDEEAERQ